jgi:thiamine-monophosphate kinase
VLSVAVLGDLNGRAPVLRSGAKAGAVLAVAGELGRSAAGYSLWDKGIGGFDQLRARHLVPEPPYGQGVVAAEAGAQAMIDISDGLVADLGHIAEASGVGAVIEAALLPLSPAARAVIGAEPLRLSAALSGGDDYELLFTAAADAGAALTALADELGLPLTRIGRIEAGSGVEVVDDKGAVLAVPVAGYRHF